jgi:hypothetical protein
MSSLPALLLCLAVTAADKDAKPAPQPARVTVTAELACLHCTFGEGDGCAVCLKLDAKTPVLLAGKIAKQFHEDRLGKKVVVVEGTLSRNKDKRLVLTGDSGRFYTDKDKGKVPAKGEVRVAGKACCGQCDLKVCDECTLAVVNGKLPIILHGKLASGHAEKGDGKTITASGKLFIDKRGLVRLDARKVDLGKKKK